MSASDTVSDLERERREAERALREKEQYNDGIDRVAYNRVLAHTSHYYNTKRKTLLRSLFAPRAEGKFLELGSSVWEPWLEEIQVYPKDLTCINISEAELQLGIDAAVKTVNQPKFVIMDANRLEFEDNTFDVVYGAAILHHLDYERSLKEIQRVLKPGGIMVFREPLDMNPVGRIVRALTPAQRTVDERPLRMRELQVVKDLFNPTFHYEEFLSVPLGVISKMLFSKVENPLTRSAFALDEGVVSVLPPVGVMYRHVVIEAAKRAA